MLYWQTHTSHWNVTAPDFISLHQMFEEQYTFLWNTLDELAERYRALELPAPIKTPSVDGKLSLLPRAELLASLLAQGEATAQGLKDAIEIFDDLDDTVSEDLAIGILATIDKNNWMLRSSLK